jgi:hypothetical protein
VHGVNYQADTLIYPLKPPRPNLWAMVILVDYLPLKLVGGISFGVIGVLTLLVN